MQKLSKIVQTCINKGNRVISEVKKMNYGPNSIKKLDRVFTQADAARLVGVSAESIRLAEAAGKTKKGGIDEKSKRRIYSLEDINIMRDHFMTRPGKGQGDETLTVSFINFKGGVYKSTVSTHFAQYMALQGYRVLFVDADSQGTSTRFFGITPDAEEEKIETLYEYFSGEEKTLEYCIKKTCWDGLDLIPASLELYNAELDIPRMVATNKMQGRRVDKLLLTGIATVKNNYDIVVVDAPPSLGIISMNVIYCADALVIPTPPQFADFASTLQFFEMLGDIVSIVGERDFKFIKLLVTKFDGSDESKAFLGVIKHVFGSELVMENIFSNTAEIPRAGQNMKTVYEVTDVRVKKTYDRAIKILDKVNNELELLVKSSWLSKVQKVKKVKKQLAAAGVAR